MTEKRHAGRDLAVPHGGRCHKCTHEPFLPFCERFSSLLLALLLARRRLLLASNKQSTLAPPRCDNEWLGENEKRHTVGVQAAPAGSRCRKSIYATLPSIGEHFSLLLAGSLCYSRAGILLLARRYFVTRAAASNKLPLWWDWCTKNCRHTVLLKLADRLGPCPLRMPRQYKTNRMVRLVRFSEINLVTRFVILCFSVLLALLLARRRLLVASNK